MSNRYITLSCFVPGVPCPKGSWRIVGKRLIPDNKGEKLWAEAVGWGVKVHRPQIVKKGSPVTIRLVFVMPRPKKPTNDYPVGDVDKLTRSVLDAIKGIAYDDDVQVARADATKRYVQAGRVALGHCAIHDDIGCESCEQATRLPEGDPRKGPGVYIEIETTL